MVNRVLTMKKPQAWRVKLVTQRLREGAVIAYPTEGVWGLGCLADDAQAVARILALKGRSWEQGLILAAGNMEAIEPYLDAVTEAERRELAQVWPGPVTMLVPDCGRAPEWIRGRHDTVALRVSTHPVIVALTAELGEPIVSTSANPSSRPAAKSELRLRQYFPEGIDYIFPGELGGAQGASEIRVLRTGEVIRSAS